MLTPQFKIALVTAPSLEVGKSLVQGALDERLIACGTLLPHVESHYWWNDKQESAAECQIILKTRSELVDALAEWIQVHHPYDTPEFLVFSVEGGLPKYLEWILKETRPRS